MPKWKMYSTKISMWWRQWLWRQVWWTKLQREQVNHFFFAFNLRGLSGVYYYWGKVGRMMEMTANHIMYWSDCHWHFVKMSQMQIFYTKSCNLCQARTRYQWIILQYVNTGKYCFILEILILGLFTEVLQISILMLSIKNLILIYWYFQYFPVSVFYVLKHLVTTTIWGCLPFIAS